VHEGEILTLAQRQYGPDADQRSQGQAQACFVPAAVADPPRCAGVCAAIQPGRDAGADRVQVHVGHGREHGPLIEQGLALVASFPEAAGAAVLAIGAAGQRLVEAAHEPAEVGKALAEQDDALGVQGQGGDARLGVVRVAARE
jgi:hypothetical protein